MKKIIVILGLLVSHSAFSSPVLTPLWHDIQVNTKPYLLSKVSPDNTNTIKNALNRRVLTLNEQELRSILTNTSVSKQTEQAKQLSSKNINQKIEINLPLPNGKFVRIKAFDSPILSKNISERFPDIKTWRIQGVDNPEISGRLDFTSKGFHGMLNMPDGDVIFIDPDKDHNSGIYQSLSKRENILHFKTDFNCQVHEKNPLVRHLKTKKLAGKQLAQMPSSNLRVYRLAIAGTAEYTESQGGTSSAAFSSMVTTINRVNDIYQRDLGVKLEIVSGDSFAYTDASTDPYTNDDATSLVHENIDNINTTFGASNYDIGHVFAQGALGGLSYVGAACLDNYKAGGATGTPTPQGEIFAIEFVAHEMGHQLGATHTFNSEKGGCGNGNRSAGTAVEPGSGSTIMSYSGLCQTDNIQSGSDAMFHSVSIEQISDYTRIEEGSRCGTNESTGSSSPIADADIDAMVPIRTPLALRGLATGGVTYSWEQIDAGSTSPVEVDTGDNAIIRTFLPTTDKNRYIPRLSDLFAGTQTIGEMLPQTARDLNFAFVVRNNNGGVEYDRKLIRTTDTGSEFKVTSQSTAETFTQGENANIGWLTGNTEIAPINCTQVDILLIRESGETNILLENTNNDGNQTITIPLDTPLISNARVMVACSNQPFFQISSGSITVQKSQVTDNTPPSITITGSQTVTIEEGGNYTELGATANDETDGILTVTTTGTVNTSIVGTYNINYTATDAAGNTTTATRIVQVISRIDNIPPSITITGSQTITIEEGGNYTELGATANDETDGILTVTTTGTVNTSIVGTYNINYTATDAAGNTATAVRIVKVISKADTTPPVITLVGSSNQTIIEGTSYIDAGATATDNIDNIISISTTGTVNTKIIGIYTITYTAIDSAGNSSSKTRTIEVISVDKMPPIITLTGNDVITLKEGQHYIEPGFSATDDHDGTVEVIISGKVDTNTVGTYIITYTASDSVGNSSHKQRTIKIVANTVKDITPPVITLEGSPVINLTIGDKYSEPGFTAVDNFDKQVDVNVSGTIDINKPGTYILTYTATDAAGNKTTKKRTVIIKKEDDTKKQLSGKAGGMGFLLLPFLIISFRRFLTRQKHTQ